MKNLGKFAATAAIWLPASFLFWLIFAGSSSKHELMIGGIAAVLTTTGVLVVSLQYPARFSPTGGQLLSAWRLPWYLISGTWEVLLVAARDAFGGKRAQSLFRMVHFRAGKQTDPEDTARRALAALYTTVAPNFIVLGINVSDQTLLFHQIERSSVPKMTQALGARP